MADSQEYQSAAYPLMAYNFRVTIDGQSMSFAEVAGLQREHQTLAYRHGLSHWEGARVVKFRNDKFVTVTMKRGTVPSGAFLYTWLESRALSSLSVSLCDRRGLPLVTWHIAKAIPVKLMGPELDAMSGAVAVDSLEVDAAGISIESVS